MHVPGGLIAPWLLLAAALLIGCPGDGGRGSAGAGSTARSAAPVATSAATASAKPAPVEAGAYGTGVIKGVVTLTGKPPVMVVPPRRMELPFCKTNRIPLNAVLVKDGKLRDVVVTIADGQLRGSYSTRKRATLDQRDCMFEPRAMAVMVDQKIDVRNSDPTVHNVRAKRGTEVLFNIAQPRGGMTTTKSFEEPGIVSIDCDIHPWMRAFAIVTDNPFSAVTGDDGSFTVERVPDGSYQLVAWHARYGAKNKTVEVKGGEVVVDFVYSGDESEPPENKGELANLE